MIAQHSLRRPTRDDVDFYFFVRKTLFKDIVSTYSPWDEDRELSSMASRMNPEKDWVIECDNVPVGLFSYGDYEDCIYLDMVSILPSHQNRGIGTSLLDSIKAKLNGRCIRLDVHENNTRAIRYYEKRGFVVFGAKRAVGAYPKLLMEFRLEK